jgi:hypothetical protein
LNSGFGGFGCRVDVLGRGLYNNEHEMIEWKEGDKQWGWPHASREFADSISNLGFIIIILVAWW